MNRLILNTSKTNAMILGSSTNTVKPVISIGDLKIVFLESVKLLGVFIDCRLNLSVHITELCKKINRKAYILSRCFFMYSHNFRVTLFKLFNMSNFGYCSSLFIFTRYCYCMTKLCSVFKRNVQLFLNVDLCHANLDEQRKLLRPFRLMPLKHRLFVLFAMLIYHILNDQAAVVILLLIFPTLRLPIFYLTTGQE